MKKTLLLLLLTLLSATSTTARDFTYTHEGQTLTYTVIDEEAKTCETTQGDPCTENAHSISGSLTIPRSASGYTVTTIGNYSFYRCYDLTELTIPTSVDDIGNLAFHSCFGLTSVTLPVSYIGSNAFGSCSGLTSVTFTGVRSIGNYAFENCSALTSVYIPKSCTSVGRGAFGLCSNLLSIEVDPENEKYTSSDGILFNKDYTTLVQCPGGKEGHYIIPESVRSIEKYAFAGCRRLTSISIPESVTTIDDFTFEWCEGLTSISIPESVNYIRDYAFNQCPGLTSIELPKAVNTIGMYAFRHCRSLTSISIPESMKYINSGAFSECTSLTEIQCFMQEPCTADENIFESETYENATLYVPAGTVSIYQATTPWNLFKNITDEPLLSGIEDVVADGMDAIDYTQPYDVYNLQGALVGQSTDGLATGVYIVRQGEKSAKVAIR